MEESKVPLKNLRVRTGLAAGKAALYGTDWCGFTTKQRQAFDAAHVPYDYINCDTAKGQCAGITSFPTVKGYPNDGDQWVGFKPV